MKKMKRIAAWILAGSMVLSSSSFHVLAQELAEEATVEEVAVEELEVAEEEPVTENPVAEDPMTEGVTAAEETTEPQEDVLSEVDVEEQILGEEEIVFVNEEAIMDPVWEEAVTEAWGMDIQADQGDFVFPGTNVNLWVNSVWRDYQDENGEWKTEEVHDLIYQWHAAYTDESEIEELILYQDGANCNVNVPENAAGKGIWIYCEVFLDDQSTESVIGREFVFNVAEQFYSVEVSNMEELENLQPGQSAQVEPQIYNYVFGQEAEIVDSSLVSLRFEWDESMVEITDAKDVILTSENPIGTAPFTIRRLWNGETGVTVCADLMTGEEMQTDAARFGWWMREYGYEVWYEELREHDWTWVFDNETYTLNLNTENLADKENTEIVWELGRWDEEAEGIQGAVSDSEGYYEVSEDGCSITLHGNKLAEVYNPEEGEGWCHLSAAVYAGDVEVFRHVLHVDVANAFADYQHPLSEPGDRNMLVGHGIWMDNRADVRVENADYPYGEWVSTDLLVEVLGQYDWDNNEVSEEDPVVAVYPDENGWQFEGLRDGYVRLKLTWTSVVDGEEDYVFGAGNDENDIFELYVTGDKTYLEMDYPDRSNRMTFNSEMQVWTSFRREWRDDEGNYDGEDITDYYLEVDEESYDHDLVTIEINSEDPTKIDIRSHEWEGDGSAYIKAFDGEGNEIGGQNVYFEVYNEYYSMVLLNADGDKTQPANPIPGAELNLNEYQFEIRRHSSENQTGVAIDNSDGDFRVRMLTAEEGGYNSDVLEEVSQENTVYPILKRISDGGTHLQFVVEHRDRDEEESEIWNEWGRSEYFLDGLDYSTEFEDLRGGDHTWIFTGEELTLSLREENLFAHGEKEEDLEIQWKVGIWNEESEDLAAEGEYYTAAGTSITLKGAKLTEKYLSDENNWFDVEAVIYVNGLEVMRRGCGVEICQEEYQYDWPFSGSNANLLLPGWEEGIGTEMNCWVRNPENQDGADMPVKITDAQVLGCGYSFDWEAYENGEAQVYDAETELVEFGGDANDGWYIHAMECGFAHLQITYIALEDGEQKNYDFPIFIGDQRYDLSWSYPDGVDWMLVNDTITIDTSLYGWIMNENGEFIEGELGEYQLRVTDEEGNPMYDTNLIQIEVIDGTKLSVTSNENCWGTDIWVRVFGTDRDGNTDVELTGQNIWINVEHGYHYMEPQEISENPLLLQELDLNALEKAVYSKEADGIHEVENVKYRIEYDPNAWDVKEGTEEDEIPVLIRKKLWGTDITLIAMQDCSEDGSGDWQEFMRRDYGFEDISGYYELDYVYSYGEHSRDCEGECTSSYALTDVPLELTLDESGLNGLEGFEVVWDIWFWDEEKQENIIDQEILSYEISEDGRTISLTANEAYVGQFVDIEAHVIYNDAYICGAWTHVRAELCEHVMDQGTVTKTATCTEEGTLLKTCTLCGVKETTEVIKALGHTGGTATCTNAAVCTRCKQSYGSAKGHSWASAFTVDKKATCTEAGSKSRHCTVAGCTATTDVTGIPATGHKMVLGEVISEATIKQAKQQQQTCANGCGTTNVVSVGSKLTPSVTLTDKQITLKYKQSTSDFKITGLANGDQIKSITIDQGKNNKYVTLSNVDTAKGTLKLTAKKKKGTTKLIIELESQTITVPVKVQSGTVKTTKLTTVKKDIILSKKGAKEKVTWTRAPFTAKDKVKYSSKNKKIAKVSSSGQITAVAPGTTTVTAKAGKGSVKYTVTVQGIGGIKTSASVKRNKTLTLKPKLYGISGNLTASSSKTSVATVTCENGKVVVKGVKKGSANITIRVGNYSVKCKVKVK